MPRKLYPPGRVEIKNRRGKSIIPSPIFATIQADGFTVKGDDGTESPSQTAFLSDIGRSRYYTFHYIEGPHAGKKTSQVRWFCLCAVVLLYLPF
jgi:hypothetical protein